MADQRNNSKHDQQTEENERDANRLEEIMPKIPPVYGNVEVAPTRIYPEPRQTWTERLFGYAVGEPQTVISMAAQLDPRVTTALPPGYIRDEYGRVFKRVARPRQLAENVQVGEDDPNIQRYRESLARRILDEQLRRNIRYARTTTGRRAISPAEYAMFASQFGRMPNTLDVYIPYYGMEAARQQTQRSAAQQWAAMNAAATGAAIDRQHDEYMQRLMENAARERQWRIAALQGFAGAAVPPAPPYAPPGFALPSGEQAIGPAYGTAVGAQLVDPVRASLIAVDEAARKGTITPEQAEAIKREIAARTSQGG